ncbi:type II toxin-antitoxin system RelE/ParE family toxin [Congregibacter litoralis]|uniref:type II toxin-antitoxin system RelE/ParE family toxin n=1 Tax=Congregibacter litoralis TaxID=393662 RepID=UPI000A01068F|nr:type II toxin-antitoxin system RelE/ParE family toxin [Congregibacter litoralis]
MRSSREIALGENAIVRVLPGNRLEALKGNLKGFHSIRINDQWRLVCRWSGGQSHDVQIVDYHR